MSFFPRNGAAKPAPSPLNNLPSPVYAPPHDPRNGLCLNALYDRAFDPGLMSVDKELRVRFSPRVRDEGAGAGESADWLLGFDGRELILPPNFSPDLTLLARHRERWYAAV